VEVEVKRGNIAGVWIIPRSTVDLLGFFNEEYLYYGGEDSDYGHRIMAAGLLNTYLPHMKGVHLGAEDGVYSANRTDYVKMKAKWWDLNMGLFQQRARDYDLGRRALRVERALYLL
jgi:GT2 family glycosyltransferase